jgi:hypothetical protein
LNDNHEPESAEAALVIYSKILLPERNQDDNIRRLTAMVKDVNLEKKISDAAEKNTVAVPDMQQDDMMMQAAPNKRNRSKMKKRRLAKRICL